MCYWIWVHSATITILVYIHNNIQWVIVGCDVCEWLLLVLEPNSEASHDELYYNVHERGNGSVCVTCMYTWQISDMVLSSVWEIFFLFCSKIHTHTSQWNQEKWAWHYCTRPAESRERPLPVHHYAYTYTAWLKHFYTSLPLQIRPR